MSRALTWLLAFAVFGKGFAGSGSTGSTCVYTGEPGQKPSSSGSSSGRRLAGSSSSNDFTEGNATYWCTNVTYDYFASQGCDKLQMAQACIHQCPHPRAPDFEFQCSDPKHGHHAPYDTWHSELTMHSSLQWNLFFVIFCLLFGGLFRMLLPSVPYTVGLLVVFVIIGVVAGVLERDQSCPHHAWSYNADHGDYVELDEWAKFIGTGFNRDSFCSVGGQLGSKMSPGERVCVDTDKCKYTLDDLDKTFKLSSMLATRANKQGADDGKLSADELWTVRCNLLHDAIGLSDIDPHVLLTVFLPALLFESAAFGVDMGIFKKQKMQIILMAFPAMILASFLTGGLIYAMFDGEWTLWVCWLIGVISSATDPVAVVALLKDLGASKSLGTIIEGESLLNDGSAVVLFVWIRNAIGYDYSTLGPGWMQADTATNRYDGKVGIDFVVVVSQMLLFGVVFGVAFGVATRFLLRFVYNDRYVEGSFLIGMSYLCFWLGELVTGTSAVIAVVVMGLYINEHKSALSPAVLHYMHQFYEMIAHILNTIIFAIAGAKLGTLIVTGTLIEIVHIFSWRLFMIYPIVLFTRGVAILVFFPFLRLIGTGCTWKEALVMWWGGLRGSVGLALGLVVFHTTYDANQWGWDSHIVDGDDNKWSLDCRDQPQIVLLMNMIVVLGTVVINGMTMAPLMSMLKLTAIPMDRRFQLNAAYLHLRHVSEKELAQMITEAKENARGHKFYSGADWSYVYNKMVKHHELFNDVDDVRRAAWTSVLVMERASYLAQFEAGRLASEPFLVLENFMATLVADASRVKTDELSALYDKNFKSLLKRLSAPVFGETPTEFRQLVFAVYVAYHEAQAEVHHAMHVFHPESESTAVVHKAVAEACGTVDKLDPSPDTTLAKEHTEIESLKADALAQLEVVRKEHVDNDLEMESLFETLLKTCDSADTKGQLVLFKSQHALNRLLLSQRDAIEHMRHEGILTDLDAAPLNAECNERLGKLKLDPLLEKVSVGGSRAAMKRSMSSAMDAITETSRSAVGVVSSTVSMQDVEIVPKPQKTP